MPLPQAAVFKTSLSSEAGEASEILKGTVCAVVPAFVPQNHLTVLGLLVFEATVHRHQRYFNLHNDLKPPPFSIIFQGITRQHLDQGILPCIKYFINFLFYKFGLEVVGTGCSVRRAPAHAFG